MERPLLEASAQEPEDVLESLGEHAVLPVVDGGKLSLKSYLWATRAQALPTMFRNHWTALYTSRWEPVQSAALTELLDFPTRAEWSLW
ncbi:hypothetical protein Celaphus_00005852 [Cervus elaphus hippelaphus]|uniref:Uncharacterized protein n=1 Tax=Cervus elaphus hippelaphus TaxID=46360 RepID=A0A212CVY3_CEREH|nr:hypothetical protein Celaphus_00005852 [Cervus elaphus hippelaphus]